MIISTTEYINGKLPKKTIGLVRGNTVRARWFGRDIAAAFKNFVGGEIKSYTQMISDAREEAVQRMIEHAKGMGATGVTCVRFTIGEVMQGTTEILAFGTAVVI
ncbi:MAG: YbjQ family protein [Candidatus Pacearchaeota archaeon]